MKYIVETDRLWVTLDDAPQAIEVGSADWFDWLAENDRFVYRHEATHYTARRESRRGNYYWYGYRRHRDKLRKVYLGRAADLTVPALVAAGDRFRQGEAGDGRGPHDRPGSGATSAPANVPGDVSRVMMNWLIPPALPENAIDRPRLTRQLTRPIVLITAPSGYGKTTLLNQWQDVLSAGVVWVSLDNEANTVYTFWAAVLLAWQKIKPGYELPLTLLQSPAPLPVEPLLTLFIDGLRRTQSEHPGRKVALIIDNYHRAQSAQIDASLRFFLDHLPPGVQVVLASQQPFPFDLQRWRGKGLLMELTQADLRLTLEEGLAYLERLSPLTLTEREKVALVVRADGWPAGLNLLLLGLRQQGNVHEYVATFSGHDRYLQSYVAGEILSHHPPDRRDFLLKTSVLKMLTGQLCDALTGHDDGQALLAHLHQSNQFVTLVDEARGWYQYHDLFAKALQDQLHAEQPQLLPELHRRAAAWFLESGLFPEAMRHLLLAGEWPEVGRLIDRAILSELRRGSDHRVLRWLQQLPDALFLEHDSLLITFVRLALNSLPTEQIIERVDRVAGLLAAMPESQRSAGQRSTLQWVEQWRANGEWPAVDRGLLDGRPSAEIAILWRIFDLRERALRLVSSGEVAQSVAVLEESLRLSKAEGVAFLAVMNANSLISIAAREGQLARAESMAREMLRWLRANLKNQAEIASVLELSLARIYLARNQLAQAWAAVDRAASIDPYPTSLNIVVLSHLVQAHVHNSLGDHAAARMAVQAARDLHPYGGMQLMKPRDTAIHQALILVRQGEIEAAEQLLRYELPPLEPQQREKMLHAIAWAEIQLGRGQYAAAETTLAQASPVASDALLATSILAQLLLAVAHWGQNKTHQAQRELLSIVRAAAPEGIIRPFLDCGRLLSPLLVVAVVSDALSEDQRRFVEGVLSELRQAYPGDLGLSPADLDRRVVAATISPREQELLQVLAEGLTNREIAARLVLEESTIRTHLRNIYRKLRVNSRLGAIQRAREIGLL